MKGGFIGPRSLDESIIEEAPDAPRKSLGTRGDVIDPRFRIDDSSRVEGHTQLPSPHTPARLERRVDIATLWNDLEAEGRTRYGAVWAELWRRPRRNKGCIDPTIWELRTTPSMEPSPELQAIIARINYYYAQFRGPQVALAPGSWAFYSATYPKNVYPPQFYLNNLMSTQARILIVLNARTVVRASDPSSQVIPPGSTDLLYAPTHASDMYFAIWKAKCSADGGLNPSILQWEILDDVVEGTAVQVLEYIFGSVGWYAANGMPNLIFMDKDQAAFYVLTATPSLIGMSYMLENYALDLGGYILGVGVIWEPIPPDALHPTGRRYYMWLQLFHV